MIIERAELPVKEGMEDEFASAMRDRALAILGSAPGCISLRFGRGVESPSTFILLIEWDSVQAHMDFRDTEAFGEFASITRDFYADAPRMEHFEID